MKSFILCLAVIGMAMAVENPYKQKFISKVDAQLRHAYSDLSDRVQTYVDENGAVVKDDMRVIGSQLKEEAEQAQEKAMETYKSGWDYALDQFNNIKNSIPRIEHSQLNDVMRQWSGLVGNDRKVDEESCIATFLQLREKVCGTAADLVKKPEEQSEPGFEEEQNMSAEDASSAWIDSLLKNPIARRYTKRAVKAIFRSRAAPRDLAVECCRRECNVVEVAGTCL